MLAASERACGGRLWYKRSSALATARRKLGYTQRAAAPRMSGSPRRNASLDTLRAIAVLAVFVHHLRPGYADIGDRGVDLFFVLSGYLIGGILFATYREQGTIAPFSFWRDRWLRTLPAYYATLALYVGMELVHHRHGLRTFAPYALFLQSYVHSPRSLPAFHHSWSLCVEEHFYLVLPLLLVLASRLKRRAWIVPAILLVGLLLLLGRTWLVATEAPIQIKLSHWRTDGLIVGVALAKLDEAPQFAAWLVRNLRALSAITIGVLGLAIWIDLAYPRYFELPISLACGCLVALGVAHHRWFEALGSTRVVAWVARISYSFYLVQPLVLMQIEQRNLPARFGPALGWSMAIGAGLVLSLAASQLMYTFVERPGLALRARLRERARLRARPAIAAS